VSLSNLDITLVSFNMGQFGDPNLPRSKAVPNYEIYYGDFINVLEGIAQGGDNRRIQLDSTDFTIHKKGTTFYVNRDGLPIGHVTADIDGTTVRIGQLDVNEEYRRASGLSTMLVLLSLIYGVRSGANAVTLREDKTDLSNRLWGRLGLQYLVNRTIAATLDRLEAYQADLAANTLGLARMPRTILVNTDRPQGANQGQGKEWRKKSL
jgi:hypothetical protein